MAAALAVRVDELTMITYRLGEGGGLRGYRRGQFVGNKLALFLLEDRIFPDKYLFGILAIGGLLVWSCETLF